MQAGQPTTRTRWGRSKFGSGTASALALAIPAGMLLSAATATVAVSVGFAADRPWLGATALGVALAGPMVALAWVLCVDRSTIRGAAERPEESVESGWYRRATSGAFHDVLGLTGLGVAVLFLSEVQVPGSYALLAVLVLCFASFAIRYAIQRRQG